MDVHDNKDLSAACAWATATVAAVVITDSTPLRAILGTPMVLLVPGHAVLRALGVRSASLPEHLTYAVGTSLAAGIAGGLALNALNALTPAGWAIWFWIVTIGASLLTVMRREDSGPLPLPRPTGLRPWHGVTFAAAVLITTGAYALAVRDEANEQQFKYVELWMLPPANAGANRLAVGVRSAEPKTERFDLEITLDGRPFAIFRSLTLKPGDTWTRDIPVPVRSVAQKAEAKLYRQDGNRLSRSVSALVPGA